MAGTGYSFGLAQYGDCGVRQPGRCYYSVYGALDHHTCGGILCGII